MPHHVIAPARYNAARQQVSAGNNRRAANQDFIAIPRGAPAANTPSCDQWNTQALFSMPFTSHAALKNKVSKLVPVAVTLPPQRLVPSVSGTVSVGDLVLVTATGSGGALDRYTQLQPSPCAPEVSVHRMQRLVGSWRGIG